MKSAIHLEDITVAYDNKPVLWDIDLDIPAGTLCAIVGPNGAGKSTLLKAILGFLKPLSGEIKLLGKPLKEALAHIAYVPQQSSVNWRFPITVFEVVLMGRYRNMSLFKKVKEEDKQLALKALKEMDLLPLANRQISALSGGQKQRVFIARGLCQNADLILMDEPLAGVDQKSEKLIMEKSKELVKIGKTIVCVHHDLQTLPQYFNHVVLINREVVACGKVKDIFNATNIEKTYREVGASE